MFSLLMCVYIPAMVLLGYFGTDHLTGNVLRLASMSWSLNAILFVLCLVGFITAKLGMLVRCFRAFSREYVVVMTSILVMILSVCADWSYLARMTGQTEPGDLGQFYLPRSDTNIMLIIFGCTTVTHIGMPIRWRSLIWLEVSAVLIYGAMAFGVGSPEGRIALHYWSVLVFLTCSQAYGKCVTETYERRQFLNGVEEKVLRAELEFKLNTCSMKAAAPVEFAPSQDAASQAVSGTTGHMFNGISAHDDSAVCPLSEIAKLGLKEHWLLPDAALQCTSQKILGSGAFGVVLAGIMHGTSVAIKIPGYCEGKFFVQHLANELRILRQVRHPNIVQLHGACIDVDQGQFVLVEELVEGPALDTYLGRADSEFPCEAARYALVLGFCRGLQYLHGHDPCIVHGDLKPDNVRVEELRTTPRVKLLDFGLSRLVKGTPRPLGGTLPWMAPELTVVQPASERDRRPNPAADVFSFGRLLYFVATGLKPLEVYAVHEIRMHAQTGKVLPLSWPVGATHFVRFCAEHAEQCLRKSAAERPRIAEVHREFLAVRVRAGERGESLELLPRDEHPSAESMPWQVGVQRAREAAMPPSSPTHPAHSAAPRRKRSDRSIHDDGEPAAAANAAPVIPHFQPTPIATQELMVLNCIAHWNYRASSVQCCKFHAGVEVLREVCATLRERPCRVQVEQDLPCNQCPCCFVLDYHSRSCEDSLGASCAECGFHYGGMTAI